MQSPMVSTATQFTEAMVQLTVRMATLHTETMDLLIALTAIQPIATTETLIAPTEIRPTVVMDLRAALMGTLHMGLAEGAVLAMETKFTANKICYKLMRNLKLVRLCLPIPLNGVKGPYLRGC